MAQLGEIGIPMRDPEYNGKDQGQKATDGELKWDTVAAHNALKQDSKRARLPREEEWNKNWNLYNNYYNFRTKAEWQSKVPLSRVNTSVRFAAKLFKKGLVGSRDFFSTKGHGEVGKLLAPHIHKISKFHLDLGRFPQRYYTALVSGMLATPVIMKIYPKMVEVEEPDNVLFPHKGAHAMNMKPAGRNVVSEILGTAGGRRKKRLRIMFDPCSAYDIHFDPYGRNMYLIHDIDMDYHEFKAMVESPEGRATGWNPAICKELEGEYAQYADETAEASRKGQVYVQSSVDYRRQVRLSEYWGTLVSEKGHLMFKDSYHVVVNEKYLGISPRPIRLPGKKWPYVWTGIIEKPFSTWHQTMVENVSGIQVMLTELVNLILDANLYSSVHAFELDIDQVYDPYEFRDGVFPGKTYKKRGGGMPNMSPMIRDVTLGQMPAQILEVFQALNMEYQQNFGFSGTSVPTKGKQSATQIAKEAQQSTQFLSDIARDQEENFIEPMLDKVYDYIIAYQRDMGDPALTDLLGDDAATQAQIYLNKKEYREYLEYAPVVFQADGMSRIAQRMQELDKVMAFINLLGNAGKAIPQILQQINWRDLLEMGVYALDWDVNKILAPAQGQVPQALVPDKENPPKVSATVGGGQERSPVPPGIPETEGTVPGMASMNQAFQGYRGQQVTTELGG